MTLPGFGRAPWLMALCAASPAALSAQGGGVPEAAHASGPAISARFIPDVPVALDTNPPRPRVALLSDGYYTRLRIHRVASYVTLPVMATEYFLGEQLITDERNGVRGSGLLVGGHVAVAAGLSALFAVNTVTGVWNLYEARHLPEGRARRTIHSILMLAADGGFAYTASLGGGAKLPRSEIGTPGLSLDGADQHKRAALASISVATAATLMMWLWKN